MVLPEEEGPLRARMMERGTAVVRRGGGGWLGVWAVGEGKEEKDMLIGAGGRERWYEGEEVRKEGGEGGGLCWVGGEEAESIEGGGARGIFFICKKIQGPIARTE